MTRPVLPSNPSGQIWWQVGSRLIPRDMWEQRPRVGLHGRYFFCISKPCSSHQSGPEDDVLSLSQCCCRSPQLLLELVQVRVSSGVVGLGLGFVSPAAVVSGLKQTCGRVDISKHFHKFYSSCRPCLTFSWTATVQAGVRPPRQWHLR